MPTSIIVGGRLFPHSLEKNKLSSTTVSAIDIYWQKIYQLLITQVIDNRTCGTILEGLEPSLFAVTGRRDNQLHHSTREFAGVAQAPAFAYSV